MQVAGWAMAEERWVSTAEQVEGNVPMCSEYAEITEWNEEKSSGAIYSEVKANVLSLGFAFQASHAQCRSAVAQAQALAGGGGDVLRRRCAHLLQRPAFVMAGKGKHVSSTGTRQAGGGHCRLLRRPRTRA